MFWGKLSELVILEKYDIFKVETFFSSIDKLVITYGNESFSKTKSANRVDTGLWLMKEIHVLNNPYSWIDSEFKTNSYIVESKDINNCFSKLMKDSNDVNLDRKNYFKFMKTRKIENKSKRKKYY